MKIAIAANHRQIKELQQTLEPRYRIEEKDQVIYNNELVTVWTIKDTIYDDFHTLIGLCKNYGINALKFSKKKPDCYYRRTVAYILVKRYGWSMSKAANALNYRNHAIVSMTVKALGEIEVKKCPLITAFKRVLEKSGIFESPGGRRSDDLELRGV